MVAYDSERWSKMVNIGVCDLENELSEAVRVFGVEQQGIAGISGSRLEQQQKKLIA